MVGTVGIALSGGGITGIVAGMCSLNSLQSLSPTAFRNVTFSTVSGGTIAYGVYVNAIEKGIALSYPMYDPSVPSSSLPLEITTEDKPLWFANVINYLKWIPLPTPSTDDAEAVAAAAAAVTSSSSSPSSSLQTDEGGGVGPPFHWPLKEGVPHSDPVTEMPGWQGRTMLDNEPGCWYDSDGIDPGVAGLHLQCEPSSEDGSCKESCSYTTGVVIAEMCYKFTNSDGEESPLWLVETNPAKNVVHEHVGGEGHPDVFDCDQWCKGTATSLGTSSVGKCVEKTVDGRRSAFCECSQEYSHDGVVRSDSSTSSSSSSLQANWWTDVIDLAFWEGYGIHDYQIDGGGKDNVWIANFALIDKSVCPITLDAGTSTYVGSSTHLSYGSMEMRTGELYVTPSHPTPLYIEHKTPLDVMGYSSAFWAASILEGDGGRIDPEYRFLKDSVAIATFGDSSSSSVESHAAYLADGGLVDTTGIVTLLRNKLPRIIAFYDNNDPLSDLNAPIAHLFGVSGPSNSMNNLPGPALSQVFDPELFAPLYANLTIADAGGRLLGRLSNVSVRSNAYFGVEPYVLEELLIFSTEYSAEFLDSFEDEEGILNVIDVEFWPNGFPVSMTTADANLLCMLCDWRIRAHEDEIRSLFFE